MTPAQIEAAARNKYNATGDTFYTSAEIVDYIYQAQLELAQVCPIIEAVYTTVSVASQQEYSFPTNTSIIKRITFDGKKLSPFTFRDDDAVTGLESNTTTTGTPEYYATWNETLYLRPIPTTAALTIKIFSINEPQAMSTSSALEVPSLFHMDIVDFVAAQMAYKDENSRVGDAKMALWEKAKLRAIAWCRKRKRGDSFASVQSEEQHAVTQFGMV
jgi:hypothetical protein